MSTWTRDLEMKDGISISNTWLWVRQTDTERREWRKKSSHRSAEQLWNTGFDATGRAQLYYLKMNLKCIHNMDYSKAIKKKGRHGRTCSYSWCRGSRIPGALLAWPVKLVREPLGPSETHTQKCWTSLSWGMTLGVDLCPPQTCTCIYRCTYMAMHMRVWTYRR